MLFDPIEFYIYIYLFFLKLDYQGRVVSTDKEETAVQFQHPRMRQDKS
jgi:hypothetical protein